MMMNYGFLYRYQRLIPVLAEPSRMFVSDRQSQFEKIRWSGLLSFGASGPFKHSISPDEDWKPTVM